MTSLGGELIYEPGVEPILTPKEIIIMLEHNLVIAHDRGEVETEEHLRMELNEQYTIEADSRPST